MIKKVATTLIGTSLFTQASNAKFRKAPLVVLYHGITEGSQGFGINNYRGKHVSSESFVKQLLWLKNNFEIVPLLDIEKLAVSREVPKKALCAITFDDGYKNNFEVAYPILKKLGIPATIFITTGFIDRALALWPDVLEEIIGSIPRTSFQVAWEEGVEAYPSRSRQEKISSDMLIRERLKSLTKIARDKIIDSLKEEFGVTTDQVLSRKDYAPLSWQDIAEMSSHNITFGAHTSTHPILSKLSGAEQKREIQSSIEKLEEHGIHAPHFAYPNGQRGDWNSDTIKSLSELGFSCAWTTQRMRVDTIHDNLFELPRITLDNTEDIPRFRALASNAVPFLKSLTKKRTHDRSAGKSN